jgi:hypothetical protein
MNRNYMESQLKKATSYLAKLVYKGDYIRGNPVIMKRVCGNPRCRCKLEDKKHASLYVCRKQDGKTSMTYIPARLEEQVQKKIVNYHKIKDLLEKVSDLNYSQIKLSKEKADV